MISSFRTSSVDEAGAINQLLNLPELQTNMRAMSLNRRVPGGTSTEKKGEKFSVNLEGMTLRQALHKIAKDSGGRFWIFRNYSDGSFSISNSAW
jgi:type II secretory pathway component GspD/PulD (secretin)